VPASEISRLLQSGAVTQEEDSSGCQWFAADANVNATLAVGFYPTPADANTTFQSEQLFDPGAHPFNFADRAFISFIPTLPKHAVGKVLVGTAIVTAVVNGPPQPIGVNAVAMNIVEAAATKVSHGWRP
jgi:hypothetical protein